LDDNALTELASGTLPASDRHRALTHLDECTSCRKLAAIAAGALDVDDGAPAPLRPATTFGRYVILEPLGAGAMGVVYAAYDPELGRKVALKLVRAEAHDDSTASSLQARLVREAKAAAALTHPNVVVVHDVGTLEGRVYVSMEFVDGRTLGEWLAEEPRTWRAILAVFRQAGEGLAAAHDAGIVHRDFKPDNVLVGRDGRVRVTDFGLALAIGAGTEPDPSSRGGARRGGMSVTRTGALVGTPAYMAPEQLDARAVDARADQYAFAVSLYEGLYGERPFSARDVEALLRARKEGLPRQAPRGRAVPARVRRVVLRAMSGDRDARFADMRALLAALDARPLVTPWRAAAAALAALAVVAIAVRPRAQPVATCTGAEAAWADAWNESRAQAVREAFAKSGAAGSEIAQAQITRALDAYKNAWIAAHTSACRATRVLGEQSDAAMDLRMRCLAERRAEVSSLAKLFSEADHALVDRAAAALGALAPIESCSNLAALTAPVPAPTDAAKRDALGALSARAANASALLFAGRFREGRDVVDAAIADARAVAYAPLSARLLYLRGRLDMGLGERELSEDELNEAAALAIEAKDDGTAADAFTWLVRLVGFVRSRPAEGARYGALAQASIRRIGGDDLREAQLTRQLASVQWKHEWKLEEALTLMERSRALWSAAGEPVRSYELASCETGRGAVLFEMGRCEEALASFERAAAILLQVVGPSHVAMIAVLLDQGETLARLGRFDEALPFFERAMPLAAARPRAIEQTYARAAYADALQRKGDAAAALEQTRRALESADEETSEATRARWVAGLALIDLGRAREAVEPLTRALAYRESHSATPPELAEARFALARALVASGGDRARARALAEQARDAWTKVAARYGSYYARDLAAAEAWLASR
jgi:tetratricopeptide (TPR) repeat protein